MNEKGLCNDGLEDIELLSSVDLDRVPDPRMLFLYFEASSNGAGCGTAN